MKKLLGILLSAMAMFAFGAVYWMTPLSTSFIQKPDDDAAAGRMLKTAFNESGTYTVPGNSQDEKQYLELAKAGPIAMVHIKLEGGEPMEPKLLAMGFVHELVSMVVAAMLMGALLGVLKTYTKRVGFMAVLGVIMALYANLGGAIWWMQSWEFSIVVAVHTALAWLVAGLVLAAFIKPSAEHGR